MKLEKPDLYAPSEDGRKLRLKASRCSGCSGLSFPAVRYGCPHCGAAPEQSREEMLSGEARLLTFVTLHSALVPGLEPPAVVGEAEIADGIIEEIMIAGSEERLSEGRLIQAVPIQVKRGEEIVITCRFVPVEG